MSVEAWESQRSSPIGEDQWKQIVVVGTLFNPAPFSLTRARRRPRDAECRNLALLLFLLKADDSILLSLEPSFPEQCYPLPSECFVEWSRSDVTEQCGTQILNPKHLASTSPPPSSETLWTRPFIDLFSSTKWGWIWNLPPSVVLKINLNGPFKYKNLGWCLAHDQQLWLFLNFYS